ncbi:MAG TPA: 50S ribosomal protein L1 [Gemmatales bacterium]|nr:50S ribosomal protein L1 [Gemmatales bacterium]HMP59172.1 50S ribosomal protein L1 [Gemmatales bacterium]
MPKKTTSDTAAPTEAGTEEKKPKGGKAKAEKPAETPTPPAPPAEGGMAPLEMSNKKKGKTPGKPPRRGRKLRTKMAEVENLLAKRGSMPLKDAIAFLKQNKRAKFDETVEIHMCLGIDTKQADQLVRGAVALPHGIGRAVRVLVFAQGDNVAKAKEAGADFVGGAELADKIAKEGWVDFDVALAAQDMMGVVGRLGKVLGPRGLMPTPKAGTVVPPGQDLGSAVKEFKAGKVEFRADSTGNVHAPVGKLSFDEAKLTANITTFVDAIRAAKPTAAKGVYVRGAALSATMSPGIPLSL